jgi:hypothetical protein
MTLRDFADGGLIFQGFLDLAHGRLHLVEQANVLDRYHRLVGEGLDQLIINLLVGERPHVGALQRDRAG